MMTTNKHDTLYSVTQADRDAAAGFLENWEPGPEMTVVKLSRAFARHRIEATPPDVPGIVEALERIATEQSEAFTSRAERGAWCREIARQALADYRAAQE